MYFECAAITHRGKTREINEDNFLMNQYYKKDISTAEHACLGKFPEDDLICAVCDGMGGEAMGEKASMTAIHKVLELWNSGERNIKNIILSANEAICRIREENNNICMGSTINVLHINKSKLISYNVGDSRSYLFRNGELIQLSADHTQAESLVRMGIITKEQALERNDRHTLTQYLGIFSEEKVIEPYCSEIITANTGDVFLLCSDGLSEMVEKEQISAILSSSNSAKTASVKLMSQAYKNGGKDNITVIVIIVR